MKNDNFFKSAYGKLCLMLIFGFTVLISLRFGSATMTISDFISAILREVGYEKYSTIIYSVRLPRVLGAVIAGWGLSLSGTLLQSVTRNHLASPNIIGVNSGAGLAVIISMWLFPNAIYARPLVAFMGAFITTCLIVTLASGVGRIKSTVILAGIAVTSLLNAGISFMSYYDNDILASYNYFSVGGLSAVTADELLVPFIVVAVTFIGALVISSKADVLCLGDSIALSLGVNVKVIRILCLIIASASAAAVVSFAGLLGFVGLVVPHIARKLIGSALKDSLTVSALIGAILVVIADLLGRVLLAPSELPVGIVMAFIGAPFLFYLLIRRKHYAEI